MKTGLAGFGAVTALAAACACAVPSTDIEAYVLFFTSSLDFKGGNLAGTGYIDGGNVGVNRADPNPGDNTILMNVGANGRMVFTDPGQQLVADSLRLGPEAVVFDVYRNYAAGSGWGTPGVVNGAVQGFSAPLINPLLLPALAFAPGRASTEGAADVTVAASATLAPGDYRDVQVQNGATLNLGDGVYNLRNLRTGQHATVNVTDGTILYIDGEYRLGDGSTFGVGTGSQAEVHVGSLGVGANDRSVQFGENAEAHGFFFAPNGGIGTSRKVDLFGRFWGDWFGSDFNLNVTFVPRESPKVADGGTTILLLGASLLGLGGLGWKSRPTR